jgi:ABC-type siderophore export system fused ATPase/permease subunit
MIDYFITMFFAGIWAMVWKWGIGIGLVICLCALAYFSPLYKKDFLYAAFIVVVALFFMAVGIRDERARVAAQEKALVNQVDNVVAGTKTAKSRSARDPYDQGKPR